MCLKVTFFKKKWSETSLKYRRLEQLVTQALCTEGSLWHRQYWVQYTEASLGR